MFRQMGNSCWLLVSALAVSMSLACAPKHLVYVQEVSMGLNLALGTEGNQKLTFGYERDVYAIVPSVCAIPEMTASGEGAAPAPSPVPNGDECVEQDVMSLLSINSADVSSLRDMQVSEFVATGQPAEDLARDENAVARLRDKIYGGQ